MLTGHSTQDTLKGQNVEHVPEGFEILSVKDSFDSWAEYYDDTFDILVKVESNTVLRLLSKVKNKFVLDLGCGTGRYTLPLLKKGAKITAVDVSSRMLSVLSSKTNKDDKKNLVLVNSDVSALSLNKSYYDLAVSGLMFDHIKNMKPAFKKISKLLKKDAEFIFSVYSPYKDNAFEGPTIHLPDRKIIVPTYQHDLETYFNIIKKSGFMIVDLKEPKVTARHRLFYNSQSFKRYAGRPLLLVFKLKKL